MRALEEYRRLRNERRWEEAVEFLRPQLEELDAVSLTQAGALLQKDLGKAYPGRKPLDVLVVGQCTTTYLTPVLTAWAWNQSLVVSVRNGDYDQVMQDLMRLEAAPDAVVVVPWNARLLSGERTVAAQAGEEMEFIQQAWAQLARLKCKLVQVGYDWTGPGPLGFGLSARLGGTVQAVQAANAALRSLLPPGAYFVDLESISGWLGRTQFYDDRNYRWMKQPFSPAGLSLLGRHCATGLRVLSAGRKKVLVLDLDNTLWGGVVGELGPHAVAVGGGAEGEAFLAFQKHVKQLKATGVLLAVSSKNNMDDAREPFLHNDQMVLRLEDFAAFAAAWDPKPMQLQHIAQELNLGLESFVFFDDNPAERSHVRAALPEVQVVEVPEDPAAYIRALEASLAFETAGISDADANRTAHYSAEASRRQKQAAAASPEQYLESLEMRAEIQSIGPQNLDRVVDLITKTNQFNLTTRRHSRAAVEEIIRQPGNIAFAVRLKDRFGDYGLIAVILAVPAEDGVLGIDTWLMSCRAMGRTVEHFTLNHLAAAAFAGGYRCLRAEYLPTPKNTPVKSLLPDLTFLHAGTAWKLALDVFTPLVCQVKS
jgi:FkbH-like protein